MSGETKNPADERLSAAVRDALWQYEPIRAVDLSHLLVEASDGVVVLRGLVASDAHRYSAARIAGRVPGVKQVVEKLSSDDGLEREAALALASRPETRQRRVAVNVAGGVARIYGVVGSQEEAETIRETVASVDGLFGVESRLQIIVTDEPVVLAWQGSLERRPRKPEEAPAEGVIEVPDETRHSTGSANRVPTGREERHS